MATSSPRSFWHLLRPLWWRTSIVRQCTHALQRWPCCEAPLHTMRLVTVKTRRQLADTMNRVEAPPDSLLHGSDPEVPRRSISHQSVARSILCPPLGQHAELRENGGSSGWTGVSSYISTCATIGDRLTIAVATIASPRDRVKLTHTSGTTDGCTGAHSIASYSEERRS